MGVRWYPLSAAASVDEEEKKGLNDRCQLPHLSSRRTIGKINPPLFTTSTENFPSSSHASCASLVCRGPPVYPQAGVTLRLTWPRWKSAPFAPFTVRRQKTTDFPVLLTKARLRAHTEPGREPEVAWLQCPRGAGGTPTFSHTFTKLVPFSPLYPRFWAPAQKGLI